MPDDITRGTWKAVEAGLEAAGCSLDLIKMIFLMIVAVIIASLLSNC